ncbi:indole-3-glycerol phosphate synthase TrpC [bacterium]|nr:indole-3-glycerol phosphate synthase TrpC [bacterium]MBU1153108.1 indole-3-glycerol phosphate synthase TrpC [bacterium]
MFLNKIVSHKYQEVAGKRQRVPLEKLLAKIGERLPLRDFKEAISNKEEGRINIIAEIKKASPSIGMIREDLDILEIARQYELAGAKAISVVTEKNFFKGDLLNLFKVKEVSKLPILSKDFIIDKYQIVEAALYGADAVLLIAAILSKEEIDNFLLFTRELGLSCLVEVHKEEELDKVLSTKAEIIGINNRNLHTFTIDKNTTFKLHFKIPKDKIVISESGINSVEDLILLEEKGIDAVLIGEVLLRSNDPGAKIKELLRA